MKEMKNLPGIATHGSSTAQSTKSGHVTYDIERYIERYCSGGYDEDGYCMGWDGGYWESAGSGSTNAQITPSGVVSVSNVYVNGKPIATVGDRVPESWVASPSVPSNSSSLRYVNIRPSTSGSGQGSITLGSSTVFVTGKAIAKNGSTVTTHLGTPTTITSGSSNVFTT
ncbi:MAG: hypothetical protein ACQEXX_01980 [Bacillota bacterium]